MCHRLMIIPDLRQDRASAVFDAVVLNGEGHYSLGMSAQRSSIAWSKSVSNINVNLLTLCGTTHWISSCGRRILWIRYPGVRLGGSRATPLQMFCASKPLIGGLKVMAMLWPRADGAVSRTRSSRRRYLAAAFASAGTAAPASRLCATGSGASESPDSPSRRQMRNVHHQSTD